MKTIDKEFLKSLKPCASRWENYLEHHADFSGTLAEFLSLDHLTIEDKLWVALRPEVIPVPVLQEYACRCAEHVLPIFEKQFPEDKRPREAIEVARKVSRGELPAWAAAEAA